MVLNGTIGARLHIPFPVLNRSSFGFWLSYFSVISRVILAMFWFGVQTTIGSQCVYQVRSVVPSCTDSSWSSSQMLKAIWPSIAHLPNHLPPNANITTSGERQQLMIMFDKYSPIPKECFVIFFIGQSNSHSCLFLRKRSGGYSWPKPP
jgi:Permease for cytosine/purines, uracil, thiamine, allantoin